MKFPLVAAALALLSLPAAASARDMEAMVEQEVDLVQFFGGGTPLTEAEQDRLAAGVRTAEASAPEAWNKAETDGAKLLQMIRSGSDPQRLGHIRASGRLALAVGPKPGDPLAPEIAADAAIVAAHDPVVVWDAAKKRLITRHTVQVMVAADRAGAPQFSQPVPGPAAEAELASEIHDAYPRLDDRTQVLLASAEALMPYAMPTLAKADPSRRADFIAKMGQRISAGPDEGNRLLRLTLVLAELGAQGTPQAGAAGAAGGANMAAVGYSLLLHQFAMNKMIDVIRGMGPYCGAFSASAAENPYYCNP
jgi:hypothetical protein